MTTTTNPNQFTGTAPYNAMCGDGTVEHGEVFLPDLQTLKVNVLPTWTGAKPYRPYRRVHDGTVVYLFDHEVDIEAAETIIDVTPAEPTESGPLHPAHTIPHVLDNLAREMFERMMDRAVEAERAARAAALQDAIDETAAILLLTALTLENAPHLLGKLGELRPELRARVAYTLRVTADTIAPE